MTAKLGHLASITNTVSGGMSMNTIQHEKLENQYRISIKAPGVNHASLKVSVDNDKLLVHQLIDMGIHGKIPYLINFFMIPMEVDFAKISAEFVGDYLQISLPFNELADGYFKEINIIN